MEPLDLADQQHLADQRDARLKPQIRPRGVHAPFLLDAMNAVSREMLATEKRFHGHTIRTSATPGQLTFRTEAKSTSHDDAATITFAHSYLTEMKND